jgi:XRE family aerobic/anaerobic benzoate catabolism transcriptional regulator
LDARAATESSPDARDAGTQRYLTRLGERVRNLRARRGMTRRLLARDSAVSERYLAELEAGRGNISIALLRQIALAMGVPLAELADDGPDRSVERDLLIAKLDRLAPHDLEEVAGFVAARFADAGERHHRVALIGLRGAGKTTLGRRLAEHLNVPFVELARAIEAEAGMAIDQIFSLSGQGAFRRHEIRALERVIAAHPRAVIATGGGLVTEPATFQRLLEGCWTVWVRASPEEHMARVLAQGDRRPMAGNAEAMDDLRRILAQREALYAKADAVLDTAGRTVEASLADLSALVAGAAPAPG